MWMEISIHWVILNYRFLSKRLYGEELVQQSLLQLHKNQIIKINNNIKTLFYIRFVA